MSWNMVLFSASIPDLGFPLHYDQTHGWGYLKPAEGVMVCTAGDEVEEELLNQEGTAEQEQGGFPLRYVELVTEF